ncbi:uncharacterized protein LOC113352787 [Papaver somniferum]|uniref:uncharacterized protein LOC113352787 n=1 Tax=Papaver somniferum TaxID=3469 RepID=UPI000E6FF7EE|nr:uncharacterized protein LOC113352787 [Papaver somniferum]
MKNAPGNNKLTSPDIQKEIVSAAAMETMDAIRDDVGDAFFVVMVDESRDVSVREQMAVVIRYATRKDVLLKVTRVVPIVSASCKRRDVLREKELARVVELVEKGERLSGSGLNHEASLKRPSDDTRWGTHYNTLLSLILMFPSVLYMFEIVSREGSSEARGEAYAYQILMSTFDFVFTLFLVRTLLGITNELSLSLQRKDQDIVNAMNLVKISKYQLQRMRDDGWDALLSEVSMFCAKNNIIVLDMMSTYVPLGRGRRNL